MSRYNYAYAEERLKPEIAKSRWCGVECNKNRQINNKEMRIRVSLFHSSVCYSKPRGRGTYFKLGMFQGIVDLDTVRMHYHRAKSKLSWAKICVKCITNHLYTKS